MRLLLLLPLALVSLLPACSTTERAPPAGADSPAILTGDSVYTVATSGETHAVEIDFTFTNRTAGVISLPACRGVYPPLLERWTDGEWVTAYDPPRLMCYEPPTEVAPGETLRETLRVSAGRPGSNVEPKLEVPAIEGTYRLNWGLTAGAPGRPDTAAAAGTQRPELVSNPFRLVG